MRHQVFASQTSRVSTLVNKTHTLQGGNLFYLFPIGNASAVGVFFLPAIEVKRFVAWDPQAGDSRCLVTMVTHPNVSTFCLSSSRWLAILKLASLFVRDVPSAPLWRWCMCMKNMLSWWLSQCYEKIKNTIHCFMQLTVAK